MANVLDRNLDDVSSRSALDEVTGGPKTNAKAAHPLMPDVLQGNYGRLERLRPERHGSQLWNALGRHDSIWYFLAHGPFASREAFLAWLAARAKAKDHCYYSIVHPNAGVLGLIALTAIRSDHRVVEVGRIILGPALQRTTLATEAQYLLACHVFESLKFRRYEWKSDVLNDASCLAAKRLGFAFEGVFRNHLTVKGRNCDTAWFALVEDDWSAAKDAFERWLDPNNFDVEGKQKTRLVSCRRQSIQTGKQSDLVLSSKLCDLDDKAVSRPRECPRVHSSIEFLAREIARSCIVYSTENQRIISSAGKPQKWMIDLRKLLSHADGLEAVAAAFFGRLEPDDRLELAGMESAAIPILSALALHARRNGRSASFMIVRKERKRSGLGRNIEGTLASNAVILVDDIFNTGKSLEKARVTLEQAGVRVQRVFVIIDYQSREGLEWRKRHGIEVSALFTLADFGLKLSQPDNSLPRRRYRPLVCIRVPGASPYYVVPKSTPLLVDKTLYFGADCGLFLAIDSETGDRIWEFKSRVVHPKGIWSSAAHHDGRIYFGTYNGNVHCLDAKSGAEIWCQALCEWVGSSPVVLERHGTLAIGLEYARGRASGSVCALRLDDGRKAWERWLRVVQHGSAAYWHAGDAVVFGTNDHNVIALNAKTGEDMWKFDTRRSVKYAPAIDEERGLVSFASFDGSIYILDVSTGKKIAEFETRDICYTTPLFVNGRLFCGSGDRNLYVVDLDTMSLALKFDAGARVYCSPRLIGNSVIFGTNGGVVREIDPLSLEITGTLTVPDAVTNAVSATADGKRLFVPTSMNEIYVFERT